MDINSNTLLKVLLRRGTDDERQSTTALSGEPMWTVDQERLWMGNGTAGGVVVGNINIKNIQINVDTGIITIPGGSFPKLNDIALDNVTSRPYILDDPANPTAISSWTPLGQYQLVGDISITGADVTLPASEKVHQNDISYSSDTHRMYRLGAGDPELLASWTVIGSNLSADDNTIEEVSGVLNIKSVNASKIVYDNAPVNGVIYDGVNFTFGLGTTIETNTITLQSGTHLNLPSTLQFGAQDYTFPTSGVGLDKVLSTDASGVMSWVDPTLASVDVGTIVSPSTDIKEAYNKNRPHGIYSFAWDRLINTGADNLSQFQAQVDATRAQTDTFIVPDDVYQIKIIATGGGAENDGGGNGSAGGTFIGYISVEPGFTVETTVINYYDPDQTSDDVDAVTGLWSVFHLTGGDSIVTVKDGATTVAQIRAKGANSNISNSTIVANETNVELLGGASGDVEILDGTNISTSMNVIGGTSATNNTVSGSFGANNGVSSYWGGPGAYGAGSGQTLGLTVGTTGIRGTGGVCVVEW